MTSFTRKLFNRDPTAAEAFHRQSTFEYKHTYGRVPTLLQFTLASREPKGISPSHHKLNVQFGKRQSPPSAGHACETRCGHPACSQGCVLFVDQN